MGNINISMYFPQTRESASTLLFIYLSALIISDPQSVR